MKARLIKSYDNCEVEITKVKIGTMSGVPILFFEKDGKKRVEHFDEECGFFGVVEWVDNEVKQEIMLLRLT